MDQDEDQQACVTPAAAPDPAVCAAPAADASAAARPGPDPGDGGNPLLASVPTAGVPEADHASEGNEAAEQAKEMKEGFESADQTGKMIDGAVALAKAAGDVGEGAEKAAGQAGGLLGLPGDILAAANGVSEWQKGDTQNGGIDTAIGAAGVVSDVASVADASGVANVANAVKGGLEIGKGAGQVIEGATAGDLAPGQSGKDSASEVVDGVENVLKGAADGAGVLGPEGAAVGKVANGAMAFTNAVIAPAVFGDKNEAMDNQTADGQYHGSTGNSAIDWIAGVGKYSNGRFEDSSAPQP